MMTCVELIKDHLSSTDFDMIVWADT